MSALDDIIARGNRGHVKGPNWLLCADGYSLSVIAGGGTYCQPRPTLCTCAFLSAEKQSELGLSMVTPFTGEIAHDYPDPYTHVEVGFPSAKPKPYRPWRECGGKWETADVFSSVPVDLVRELVAAHGGVIGAYEYGEDLQRAKAGLA